MASSGKKRATKQEDTDSGLIGSSVLARDSSKLVRLGRAADSDECVELSRTEGYGTVLTCAFALRRHGQLLIEWEAESNSASHTSSQAGWTDSSEWVSKRHVALAAEREGQWQRGMPLFCRWVENPLDDFVHLVVKGLPKEAMKVSHIRNFFMNFLENQVLLFLSQGFVIIPEII